MDERDEFGLTDKQWKQINKAKGGKPTVTEENGIYKITYPDGTVVTDHKNPVTDYDRVNIGLGLLGRQIVEVPIGLTWQFHGEPCERRSQASGGDPYPKKKKN